MDKNFSAQNAIQDLEGLDEITQLNEGAKILKNNLISPNINDLSEFVKYLLRISRNQNDFLKFFEFSTLLTARLIKVGSLQEVKGIIEEALEFSKEYNGIDPAILGAVGNLFSNLGGYYGTIGNIRRARECFDEALTHYQKVNFDEKIASSQINIAAVYLLEGNVNDALERLLSVQEFYANNENDAVLGNYYKNLGVAYNLKGELSTALEFYEKSLLHKEKTADSLEISTTLHNIAEIYTLKGMYTNSEELIEKSLALKKQFNANSYRVIEGLFEKLKIKLIQKELGQAKEVLLEIEEISNNNDESEIINLYSRVATALVLKSSNRISDHAYAQTIFNKVVHSQNQHYHLSTLSTINLCELLLMELKNNFSNDILVEIMELLDRLYSYSISQKSDYVTIESLLIKAQVNLYSGNFDKYDILLETARTLAQEKKIDILIEKIENLEKRFQMNIVYWKEILLKKEDEIANMDYLEIVQYLRDVKINYNIFMK